MEIELVSAWNIALNGGALGAQDVAFRSWNSFILLKFIKIFEGRKLGAEGGSRLNLLEWVQSWRSILAYKAAS